MGAHKPEQVWVQALDSLRLYLEVVCDLLGLFRSEVFDAMHPCLQDLFMQESLDELVELLILAAESKDALDLLLGLLVALLLADLKHLNH